MSRVAASIEKQLRRYIEARALRKLVGGENREETSIVVFIQSVVVLSRGSRVQP